MLKIENYVTASPEQWEIIIEGMRNPMNSWDKSDSYCDWPEHPDTFKLGENDLALMHKLAEAGSDDRKFMRMIPLYLTITAPLYWWKEFDTYKVGTVTNSCSTMHKIHAKKFGLDDFSCENLDPLSLHLLREEIIPTLNTYREDYLIMRKKTDWWQMIQLLPTSFNQRRTVMMNYEVARNIYHARRNHKLDEWHTLCDFFEAKIPHNELIIGVKKNG